MNKDLKRKMLERTDESYKKALQVCPPDQYQFRQNDLLIKLSEFILCPYWEELKKENEIDI